MSLFRKRTAWPNAAMIFRRALILKAQVATAMPVPPPDILESWDEDGRKQFLDEHARRGRETWSLLRDCGAWDEASEREQWILLASPEKLQGQPHLDAMWAAESAVCMIWALGYLDRLPPYDVQVYLELNSLPTGSVTQLAAAAILRSRDELNEAHDLAELWHWRSRTRMLQEAGRVEGEVVKGQTIDDVIRMAAEKAAANLAIPAPIGGDFPVLGKAYRDLTAEEWSGVTSIAMERHKALNWLCGYAPGNRGDETPTET